MRRAVGLALGIACCSAPARAQILPEGECAGVYWDLTAAFPSGDRVYARVLVTHSGPGERNAAAFGHWIEPDGARTPFQNGRSEGEFELSAAGDRVRIGSTRLDLGAGAHRFEVDNDKRGVKLAIEIETPSRAAPSPVFSGDPELAVLDLGARAHARAWHTGMAAPRALEGSASLVRTRHRACEVDVAPLRADIHRLGPDGASLLIYQRGPDGAEQSWLGWRNGDGALESLHPDRIALEDWRPEPTGTPLPRLLRLKGHALSGVVAIGAVRLSIDPLDALPRLVRMLYWFGASPRRIWTDATSEIASSASETLPRGAAIASFTFLRPPQNAVPPERRER